MRKFHTIAALCGDGLRPELQALFDRLAGPHLELFVRRDGMIQSGPDPVSEAPDVTPATPKSGTLLCSTFTDRFNAQRRDSYAVQQTEDGLSGDGR
jgi:hypothetical protein